MSNTISLKTLESMGSCKDGQDTFKSAFGNKEVTIKQAFSSLPKKDVIWFVVHGLYTGDCPPKIRSLIDSNYHPNRKRHAILWLERNYHNFIESVLALD